MCRTATYQCLPGNNLSCPLSTTATVKKRTRATTNKDEQFTVGMVFSLLLSGGGGGKLCKDNYPRLRSQPNRLFISIDSILFTESLKNDLLEFNFMWWE